jgi:DNA polymerase III subunit beta
MKIQLLKENLKYALSVVERATAKTPTLPVLGAIALSAQKNTLELSATDLEIGIRYKLLSKIQKEGSCAVPSRLFSQLVGVLPEKEIHLSVAGGELSIDSQEHHTTLKTFPIEDFPIIPSLQGSEEAVEIETREFCAGLNQVVGVVGQSQARPEISGVFISVQKERIKLVATDSFRLAEKTIGLAKSQGAETSFILPQKTAKELAAILGDLSGKTKLYLSPSQALFEYAVKQEAQQRSFQIVSRLIEGEYPQYQDVIPKDFIAKAVVSRQEIASRIRGAAVFSGKLQDVKVKVDPKKKGLEISSQSAQVGTHSSFLAGEVSGKALEISFNWRFLLEGLLNMKAEEVEIAFAGEDAPALLRPINKEQYLYVVMPVKA